MKGFRRVPAAAVLAAWFAAGAPVTAPAQQEVLGFAETRLSLFSGVTGERWQLIERLRPTFQVSPWGRASLVVTVEAHLTQGRDLGAELRRIIETSDLGPLLELAGCEWPDRGHRLFRVRDARDYLAVDRFYLDLYQEGYDLRIGRQSLHWGSAQFFNPTDPFPEVLLAEPWRPRRGVNAVRATIPFGAMNDVTAVAAVDDGLRRGSGAARVRLNTGGFDLAFSGAWRGDTHQGQVGVDLRGTTVVGWWVEGAIFPGADPYTELVVGIDYSFPVFERLVVLAQYYRSGSGAADPVNYVRALPPAAAVGLPKCDLDLSSLFGAAATDASPFRRFTMARDYLLAGATSSVTPDFSANAFVLQNLNDGTALFVPTLSFLATSRLDLSVSAMLPFRLWGRGGEFQPRPGDLRLEGVVMPGTDPISLDVSGLVPTATVTLWARLSF